MRKKKNLAPRMEKCESVWVKNPQEYKGGWKHLFGNDNPIHLEIGCGKGAFITGMAKKYPNINFLAVEKVEDVIVMAMEKAVESELKNVYFIDINAEELTDIFAEGEIERIYLNFSDPWKKKKQAKRRLTHKNFLDRYKRILKPGGYIWFKTDNKDMFEFSLNSFAEENFKLENITFDLHSSDFKDNVMTEYERRFSEVGMPIYRLEAVYLDWKDKREKPNILDKLPLDKIQSVKLPFDKISINKISFDKIPVIGKKTEKTNNVPALKE